MFREFAGRLLPNQLFYVTFTCLKTALKKKISRWARGHPHKSQFIIAIVSFILFVFSLLLGSLLLKAGLLLLDRFAQTFVLMLAVAIVLYPGLFSNGNRSRTQYTRRKLSEFFTGLAVFLLVCFMANRDKLVSWNMYAPATGHYVSLYDPNNKALPEKRTMTKKQLRKELKAYMKQQKEETGKSNWLPIIGILLGAIALLFLLMMLACSVSCAGGETAAVLILIFGTTIILFLAIWGIKKLSKKNKSREINPPVEEET